jgi:hypothetical protein
MALDRIFSSSPSGLVPQLLELAARKWSARRRIRTSTDHLAEKPAVRERSDRRRSRAPQDHLAGEHAAVPADL